VNFALPRRIFILAILLSVPLYVMGCGKSVSGVYTDDSNSMSVNFQSGGKASVTVLGSTMDGTYTIDGKTLTVNMNGDNKVFTINDDGSIAGPGTTLKKK
jgi:hypothetical protein